MDAEERKLHALIKTGIMRLGDKATPEEPNAFRHVLRHGINERKGQRCRILHCSGQIARIEFEDGHKTYVNRYCIVRAKC
jgi:hypothetical protein